MGNTSKIGIENIGLMEYRMNSKSYYDINGVQILMKLSKSQSQKVMTDSKITSIKYLNRILYLREEILEMTNLKNLQEQIKLRIMERNNEDN